MVVAICPYTSVSIERTYFIGREFGNAQVTSKVHLSVHDSILMMH